MSDFELVKIPKHILYNGNLYELVDTDVVSVTDITVNILKSKLEQLKEQKDE